MENKSAFYEACERGDIVTAANLLRQPDLSFRDIAANLETLDLINKIEEFDEGRQKELQLAEDKDRLELMKQLAELVNLCDIDDKGEEVALKMAVRLGFNDAVEFLFSHTCYPLHYIVELNQVKLVNYLNERKVVLSEHINRPYQPDTNPCDDEGSPSQRFSVIGDTPLHIAARNKYEHMVNLLLKVPGVNKLARNSEKKTPFHIAREVTEYHESFWMIRKLAYDRSKPKPFMFCAPEVSHEKLTTARKKLDEAYEARRNAELVVAALLSTMTCAAAFTVPGGFNSESSVKVGEMSHVPPPSSADNDRGSPILISLVWFKLFIICDCIAFFLSLFVCIMWEMSSELTTGNKMVFMSINSLVVCFSFAFTAYGFMAGIYAMLAHKVKLFSWVVLGCESAITLCGILVFIHHSVQFLVKRARVHRLCGVNLCLDRIVERVCCGAERCGFLAIVRFICDDYRVDCSTGQGQVDERLSSKKSHTSRSGSSNSV